MSITKSIHTLNTKPYKFKFFAQTTIINQKKGASSMANYQDLSDLLLHNERAKQYYKGLSDTTQIALSNNGSKICSMEDLRHFVSVVEQNKH